MSLINQMLKDIDQRQGASAGKPAANHDLRGVVQPHVATRTWWWGGGLLLALMAVAAAVLFKAPMPVPPVQQAKSTPVAVAPVAVAPVAPVAPVALVAPAPVASAPAPVAVKLREPAPAVVTAKVAEPVKANAPATVAPELKGSVSRVLTADQRAQNMYSDAVALIQQGRLEEAQTLLLEGQKIAPQRTEFVMALAHVQLASNDVDAAIKALEGGLPGAANNAEFQGLLATLLQRVGRHEEAIDHYVSALRLKPDAANWLLGLGISLQAKKDDRSAAEAYQRAIALGLSPSLMQFAQDRLRQVSP